MKEFLQRLPKELQDLLSFAADIAAKDNFKAFLVGGFVRDLILGVKNLDLDIVIEGDGIKFAEDFSGGLNAKLTRHARFGTATVELAHNLKIDIASARVECYPEPACLPLVSRGSIKDDLKRRDFSINAMAISINKDSYGKLIDFFEGRSDLCMKKIRVLHSLSFMDDPTRLLRAIRFEKRYGFHIEAKTLSFLKEACGSKMLEKVQPHRLRDELVLLLKEKDPRKQIKRMEELVGLDFISRNIRLPKKNYKFISAIAKEIKWFRGNYSHRRQLEAWLIYLIGLTDSLNMKDAKRLCNTFAFRNGDNKRMLSFKNIDDKFIRKLSSSRMKPSQIFGLLEQLSYEVIIAIKAKYGNLVLQRNIRDFLEIYNGMRICISGNDLRQMGIPPGVYYKKVFAGVLKAKLNGLVKTKEEELLLIRKLVRNGMEMK